MSTSENELRRWAQTHERRQALTHDLKLNTKHKNYVFPRSQTHNLQLNTFVSLQLHHQVYIGFYLFFTKIFRNILTTK